MTALRDLPEIAGLEGGQGVVRIPQECDVPLTRARAGDHRHGRVSPAGAASASWAWSRWSTRRPITRGSSIRWAFIGWRCCSCGNFVRRAVCRGGRARPTPSCSWWRPCCTTWGTGRFAIRSRTCDCRACRSTNCSPTASCWRAKSPTRCATSGAFNRATSWRCSPASRATPRPRMLASMLSGPIDIDKMDYLARDSLHAGVPYGRNFDQQRLIGSLCLNAAGDGLAITDKGKTAAEMMVFARYVMFSEVYWHHGVRAATAMLQRAFYLLHGDARPGRTVSTDRRADDRRLCAGGRRRTRGELLDGLFGPHAPAVQAAGTVQLLRAAGDVSAAGPAALSLAGRVRRAVRCNWPARPGADRGAARNTLRCAAGGARGGDSTIDVYLPQGETATARWARSRPWSIAWPAAV